MVGAGEGAELFRRGRSLRADSVEATASGCWRSSRPDQELWSQGGMPSERDERMREGDGGRRRDEELQ